MRHCRDPICWSRGRPTRSARRSQSRALANRSARSFRAEAVRAVSRHWSASRRYCSGLLAAPVGRYLDLLAAIGVHMVPPRFGCTSQLLDRAFTGRSRTMRALCRNRVPRVRGLPIAEIVARARAAKTGCRVQLPRQTAHRIFAGERWTTLHGVNADFCHAFAPLGEFFAESKISRLI